MAGKRLIWATVIAIFAITALWGQIKGEKEYFEQGTLMVLTKTSAIINEVQYPLDKNAQIVDITGMKVPVDMVKLPALCKFQTNLMKGEESNTVKIVKIVILKPIKASEFHRKFLKKE